jgi:hypothetical protein
VIHFRPLKILRRRKIPFPVIVRAGIQQSAVESGFGRYTIVLLQVLIRPRSEEGGGDHDCHAKTHRERQRDDCDSGESLE